MGRKMDGASIWTFSVQSYLEEYLEQYPEEAMDYKNFEGTLGRVFGCFAKLEVLGVKLGVDDHQYTPKTWIVGNNERTHLNPYRMTVIQELLSPNFPRRQQHCQWFLNTLYIQ